LREGAAALEKVFAANGKAGADGGQVVNLTKWPLTKWPLTKWPLH